MLEFLNLNIIIFTVFIGLSLCFSSITVLEGVMKTLLKCWLNTKNHCNPWYLRPYISRIDKELSRIKPPHEFHRSPRSIESSLLYWKASEYRVFLLFYAIPVLKNYMPSEYILHLSLLVFAVHTLLSDSINVEVLPRVQHYLQLFYNLIPELYGNELCTANVHSLIHLVKFVKLWGPLWTHSTFSFENANGVLKRQIHGTRNILLQTVFMMKLKQFFSLEKESKDITCSSSQQIAENMFIVGKIYRKELPQAHAEKFGTPSPLLFGRVKLNGTVYYSRQHERPGASRKSSVVCFLQNGTLSFGEILIFSLCKPPLVLIEKFSLMKDGILEDIELSEQIHLEYNILNNIFFRVKKLSLAKEHLVIPISSILSKCVLIPVKGVEWNYIIKQPNELEHH